MHDIKTRDVVKGTIKAIDKSAVAAERMKDAYVRTKGEAEHGVFAAESSPEEYAADRTLTGTETAAHEAVHGLDKAGRKGVKVTKQNISKAKEHFQLRKADLPKKPVHNTIKANSRSRQAFASSTRKTAVKATTTAVKAVIAKAKALAAAIAAGGWVSVTVIIVVCLIGLIVGSCFGIFFSGEGSGTGQTMRQAVQEINADYQSQIDTARANLTYDELEMSGSRAVWPEVLAVYAVKTTTDPDDPQEVATVDDAKKAILKDIFWQMNEISSHIERKPGKIITETDDGHGNIVETITTVTHTYLYITVSHKTAEEMADRFNFNADQRQQLSELLAEENRSMWSAVLYGIYSGDDAIVTVPCRRSAMWAVSPIGHGMDLTPVWSGAPALYLGVRMSAAISTAALFRSSQAVSMGCSGSRTVDNGRTAALSRLPVRSFSSIGTTRAHPVRRTGSPIMSASWRNAKTALSTPSRAIPATAADSANIRWDTTKF